MNNVIRGLLEAGFVEDGRTISQTVRVPTTSSPILCGGKSGGEIATVGGRLRFRRGDVRVTVGKRTTYVYRAGDMRGIAHLATANIQAVEAAIARCGAA